MTGLSRIPSRSGHCLRAVFWHIGVVILTARIPSDCKSWIYSARFGVNNINCYTDHCVRVNTVSLENDMTKKHPSMSKKITGFIFSFAFLGVVAIGLSFYLDGKYNQISDWMLIVFMILVSSGLIGGFVMLYNVRCPDCGGKTKTIQNKKLDMWQAHCPKCEITWNLGLGTDTSP